MTTNTTLRPYRHRTPPPNITPTWVRTEMVNVEQGIPGSVAAAFWPYAIQPQEINVVNQSFPVGCFNRYGAKGTGTRDDLRAFQSALDSNVGGTVFGVPGNTYLLDGQLTPPESVDLDLNGVTVLPVGSTDLLKKDIQTPTISSVIIAGAVLGSSVITVTDSTDFAIGDVVTLTSTYVIELPWSWSRITGISGNAITIDSVLTFTYLGIVTLNVQPLYGAIRIFGGTFDLSQIVGAPGALINLGGYDLAWTKNLRMVGPMTSTTTIAGVTLEGCREGYNEDSQAVDVVFQASAFAVHLAQSGRNDRLDINGDCFGTICVGCDTDEQTNIRYRGRRHTGSANSIRAVKVSSGRNSVVENIRAFDCETVLEVFNPGIFQGRNINGVDIGLTTYLGQTAINLAASLPDGYMQHVQIDGVNLTNLGGIGLQTSGDTTGKITISNFHAKGIIADAIVLATNDTQIHGAQIENWNTGGHSGSAGIRSTATGGNTTEDFSGIIFRHTDTAKPCMNLAAGPKQYMLRVSSPTGNPIFDTVNGIDPGAQNLSVGPTASLTRASVSVLSQDGALQYFTLPIGQSMTFTFAPYTVEWQISVSNGKGGKFFADHFTAAINILANPSSFFVNGAPVAGEMGVTKSANARVVTVTNNAFDGDFDIAIQTLGGAITALTDPV